MGYNCEKSFMMSKNTARPSPYSRFRRSESDFSKTDKVKPQLLRASQSWAGNLSPYELTKELSKLQVETIEQKPRQYSVCSSGSEEDQGIYANLIANGRKSEPSLSSAWGEVTFHIEDQTIAWEALKSKLACLPSLEELVLRNVEITDLHLMDSKIFLPNLKSFTFESNSEENLDWEEIFFFYTKESKKGWTINDIWGVGVNLQVSCKDLFILSNRAESKLALSGRGVQEEFGTWGLSEFLHKLVKTDAKNFPKYISIGSQMVLKAIAYAEPIEITELNLIDIKVKTGTVNTILKNIKGLKTFRYFSKQGDGLEFNSLSPETIEEIHLSGISIDLFSTTPQGKPLSQLKHLWLTESWIGNGILVESIATRFPQLEYLTLHGIQTGDENIILNEKYFPHMKLMTSGSTPDPTTVNQVNADSGNSTTHPRHGLFQLGACPIN